MARPRWEWLAPQWLINLLCIPPLPCRADCEKSPSEKSWLLKIVLHKQNSQGSIWGCKSSVFPGETQERWFWLPLLCGDRRGKAVVLDSSPKKMGVGKGIIYRTHSLANWASNGQVTEIHQPSVSSALNSSPEKAKNTLPNQYAKRTATPSDGLVWPRWPPRESILCPFVGERKGLRCMLYVSLMPWK